LRCTLRESDSYLGAEFRRFRTRLGPALATKAMAAKLARLVYRMLRYGMKYRNQGAEFYEAQHRKQQVIHLKRKAAPLGLQIIEVAAVAQNHQWGFRAGVPGERPNSPGWGHFQQTETFGNRWLDSGLKPASSFILTQAVRLKPHPFKPGDLLPQ
jgi:hypothetical protein